MSATRRTATKRTTAEESRTAHLTEGLHGSSGQRGGHRKSGEVNNRGNSIDNGSEEFDIKKQGQNKWSCGNRLSDVLFFL